MLKRVLIASLALAGSFVSAQSETCSQKSITAHSQTDLDNLQGCKTLTGSLTLASDFTSPTQGATLNGITTILGDLQVNNATLLQSLTAPLLTTIGGAFQLTSLTVLGTLSMPFINSVGSIFWQTLPGLQTLQFNTGITEAGQVTITDTILTSLSGINLVTVQQFNINNNRYLKDVTVQLTNVTDLLAIEFNGAQVAASFPNLTWANNATFRSCGSVSLPLLEIVNGSLGFFENSFTEVITPKLTAVGTGPNGGDITFANNDDLTNVSMPLLTTIFGTLQFVNDTSIQQIEGFPTLSSVRGSIDISGSFENASFPDVTDIRGSFNCQTTSPFDCTAFNALQNSVVKGNFECTGKAADPGPAGTTPTTTGSSSSSTGGTKSAAGRLTATNSFSAIAAVALFAVFFL